MVPPFLKQAHRPGLWVESLRTFMGKVGMPVLATSLTLTSGVLGLRHLGFLQGAELAAYDSFVQAQPDQGPDNRLLVVGIDEVDIQQLAEYPISDLTLTRLIQRLNQDQPKAIGIDVIRDLPMLKGRAELLKELKYNDRVIVVCKVNSAREFGFAPPENIPEDKVSSADLLIDPGGILRRTLLSLEPPATGIVIKKHFCNNPNNTILSFSFNLALMYLESLNIEASTTPSGEIKVGPVILTKFQANMGGYRRADDSGHQLLLRYRSRERSAVQVRLTDVMNDKVSSDLIRDRIVLIGYTAPQVKDDFYTPYSSDKDDLQKMPGVIVHAQSVSQILGAVLDGQPLIWVWSPAAEMGWIFGWSLVGGILAWYFRHPFWFGVVIAGMSGTIYGISLLIFFWQGGWIPVVPAIATFVSTAVGVVLFDRFNNSTYGQTVYKTVKTFLKLDVEIDEEKLQKQVAEITETDYFRDLQDTVKSLRAQQKSPLFSDSLPLPQNVPNQEDLSLESPDGSEDMRADTARKKQSDIIEEMPPLYQKFLLDYQIASTEEIGEEFDYLEELKQQDEHFNHLQEEPKADDGASQNT